MNTATMLLPAGFDDLEPFVARWALPEMASRAQRRNESTPEERAALFDAVRDRAAAALDHLDKTPLRQLDAQDRRLRDLMLSFVHVALAIEIQRDAETGHAELRSKMRITHNPACLGAT
jgi:hypothetical protein